MRASFARGPFAHDPRGQVPGHLAHERVVQEEEGLRGDDRLAALRDDRAGVGAVEQAAEVGRVRPGAHGHAGRASAAARPGPRRRARRGVASRRPATASRLSRIASASSRRRFIRPKRRFSGSRASASAAGAAALLIGRRQHDEPVHRLHRPSRLDEPRGQEVEQAPGCVGRSPRSPKSLGVRTRPSPKWCCQIRLTMTRAVSGLSGRASQSASCSRPLPSRDPHCGSRSPARTCGNAARHGLAEPLGIAAEEDLGVLEAFVPRALGTAVLHDDRPGNLQRRLASSRPPARGSARPAGIAPRAGAASSARPPGSQNGPRAESSSSYSSASGIARRLFGSAGRTTRRAISASTSRRSASSSCRS